MAEIRSGKRLAFLDETVMEISMYLQVAITSADVFSDVKR
jgi:hypothetical protein